MHERFRAVKAGTVDMLRLKGAINPSPPRTVKCIRACSASGATSPPDPDKNRRRGPIRAAASEIRPWRTCDQRFFTKFSIRVRPSRIRSVDVA